MRRVFPSLQNSAKYAYAYDSYNFCTNAPVHDRMLMYETYGDKLNAHSGDWAITVEHLPDYLASMATQMLIDPELTDAAMYCFLRLPTDEEFAFAESIVWKDNPWKDNPEATCRETKTRYYSVAEKKLTSNPNKRYDKRYSEVEKWCDGSPQAIFRMLSPDYSSHFQRYVTAEGLRQWWHRQDRSKNPYCMEMAAPFIGWFKGDTAKARNLHYAFEACLSAVKSRQYHEQAECALRNLDRRQPLPETETETEAATGR